MKDGHQISRLLTVQNILFFSLLAIATGAFIWLINDFLFPIFWAIVLAIVFHPVNRHLVRAFKSKIAASLLTILIIIAVIFIPLWIIGGLVVEQALETYNRYASADFGSSERSIVNQGIELLGSLEAYGIDQETIREKLASFAQTASQWIAGQAVAFGQATFSLIVSFFLMLYILFFLLRDGSSIGKGIMSVLPLGDRREQALFNNFVLVTRSIFKGTLVIAIIQGALGGVLFALAGIEGALLWGVVMTVLSVIPAVGPAIVWLPAGIILAATGAYVDAGIVLLGGGVLISLIDNVLRPILVRRDVKMPDMIILVSTLGGIALFGITGFIIGPVIAGFFFSMWQIFGDEYREALETQG